MTSPYSPYTDGPYSNYGKAGYGASGNGGNGNGDTDTDSIDDTDDTFNEDDFIGLLQMAAEEDQANGWPGDEDDANDTTPEPWASAGTAREQAFRDLLGGR
jgi:hypothetical protein